MLPSLESLRCFVAAAETLNFRAASRRVALTPAALGQRIRQLEDQAGAVLFVRTTRSVRLTAAGLALVPRARAALSAAEECLRTDPGGLGGVALEIVIGTRHELGMSWLVPQLGALERAHPSLTLHLYFGSGDELLARLRTREIDCAVTSARVTDPFLDAVRLHREDYVFVGARSLLKARPFTRAEHAALHTLVDATSDLPLFRYWRDAPNGGDRLRFASVVRVGTVEAIAALVDSGRGVAVLPRYLVADRLARRTVRTILPSITPVSDWFRLVFRADDARRPVYEILAAALRETPLG